MTGLARSPAGHRILLVLDRVRDSRAEMAALQCADYLGVRRAWRVEAPQDGEEADDTDVSETSESAPTMRSVRLPCILVFDVTHIVLTSLTSLTAINKEPGPPVSSSKASVIPSRCSTSV